MTEAAGVVRSGSSLAGLPAVLAQVAEHSGAPCTGDWEMTNLFTVSHAIAYAAYLRTESRGSHWREDFPAADDDHWRTRLALTRDASGRFTVERIAVPKAVFEARQ